MADNVTANPGAGGATFASDDIGGVQFPRTKLVVGADGVNDGDVSAVNPMPVVMRDTTGAALGTAGNPVNENNAAIGAQANTAATDDTGTWSLIALTKRLLVGISSLIARTPALGIALPAGSTPVVLPTEVETNFPALSVLDTNCFTGVVGASNWFDVRGFNAAGVQIIASAGITAGQVAFEMTNDPANATAGNGILVFEATNANTNPFTGNLTIAANTTRSFEVPLVACGYFRLRITTAFVGGTIRVAANFSQLPFATTRLNVQQAVAANLNATVTGTVTANVAGTGITGGTISPLTVAGVTVEASAARTASGTGVTVTNASGQGAIFYVNVTAVTGTTPTLAVRLQVQDPVSTTWVDVPNATTASLTAVGIVALCVMPGVNEVANAKVNYPLPRVYRMAWNIGGTTPSFTFSVGAQYII